MSEQKLPEKIKGTQKEERKKKDENIAEVLEEHPKLKKFVETSVTLMSQSGGLPPEIASKVTEKHIDKVLDSPFKN